jgi:hypothetical protein
MPNNAAAGRRTSRVIKVGVASGMGNSGKFGAGGGEFLLKLGEGPTVDRGPGDQHQVAIHGNQGLVPAKNFTEPAFGASAGNGVANLSVGGDDTQSGGRAIGASEPPKCKGTTVNAFTLLANGAEIPRAAQMLLWAETHGAAGGARGGN